MKRSKFTEEQIAFVMTQHPTKIVFHFRFPG